MMDKQQRLRWLGNTLMGLGLVGVGLTFYPLLREEVYYRLGFEQAIVTQGEYVLSIPSLKLSAKVIEGVDPFDSQAYREALREGVAQARGTALPGEAGTQYLFAHSSDNPWSLARANTAFFRLPRIGLDDEILVIYQGQTHRYVVQDTKVVGATEIEYLETADEKVDLILQTCWPIGTDWKRFLVLAERRPE